MLSLRVSRDKRGYDHIYLVLEARRRGRTDGRAEGRLLYCGRWPSPCRVGQRPFDEDTRRLLESTHPDVAFDWSALLKTLQAALGGPRLPIASQPPAPPSGSRSGRRLVAGGSLSGAGARPPHGRPSPAQRRPHAHPEMEDIDERLPSVEIEPVEGEHIPGEVVLVTAEFEQREPAFTEPEFEPVCEADRQFAAAVDFELMTDEIVHIPVPEAATPPAPVTGGHVFAEPAEPAAFDTADTADTAEGHAPASEDAHDESTETANPHLRRRRRRGGRGRGKPADVR